jgi:hypothetical protein
MTIRRALHGSAAVKKKTVTVKASHKYIARAKP